MVSHLARVALLPRGPEDLEAVDPPFAGYLPRSLHAVGHHVGELFAHIGGHQVVAIERRQLMLPDRPALAAALGTAADKDCLLRSCGVRVT